MKNIREFAGMCRLGLILALYAAAACVMLAFVYTGTAKIIALRQQADLEAALRELFPDADAFNEITGIQSPDPLVTFEDEYEARRNEQTAGAALRVSRGSYGGTIRILVGIGADGRITGVKILEHQDTPGLGANAASPAYYVDRAGGITFYGQFKNKSVADPFEVKGDVQAITASTITSRAVSDSVKAAGTAAAAWFDSQAGAAPQPGGTQ
ncbi:MAG: RnfABCDGE type electron transport complex subunit G [Treponema sp.]|jgi:electron transport complex protein RnfG|nr:RnfABCDGE type electron transport complex subunit G [Treponema sp.]